MNSKKDLAASSDDSLYGKECLTAGWGLTTRNGHRSAGIVPFGHADYLATPFF